MKRKKNKTLILTLSVLAFALIISMVFYGTYYLSIGKSLNTYEKAVKSYVDQINQINSSTQAFIVGQTIDPDKIRKDLPAKIDNLSKIKDNLQGIIPTQKYKADNDNLLNGIDKNILIFKQINLILNNPNGNDLDKAGADLIKYRDDCNKYYSLIKLKAIKPLINNKQNTLVDNTSSYVNELVRLKKDNEIIQKQNLDFVNSMEGIIAKFLPIKIDFSDKIIAARANNSNFDAVVSDINKNKANLDKLSQEFSNITVPSKAITCYKAFNTSIEDYNSYMESLIYSINNEKLSGSNLTSSKITELYASSTSKYNNVIKDYSDFLKAFTDFKNLLQS
ncbi:hypothetical protein [Candidatus Clostridium radicumherbarum]|uniref:DUF3829 domain-containing protein n=1 Tax=Candidatus Clostridium radicumherbarum TaxID=3381662 RepID=A0ABW8TMT6_9CLOT